MIYHVKRREEHIAVVRVVADSPEEALERVRDAEGDEVEFYYNDTLGFDDPEEYVPTREEMLEVVYTILGDAERHQDWDHFRYVFGEDAVYDELIPEGLPDEKLRSVYERYISYFTKED